MAILLVGYIINQYFFVNLSQQGDEQENQFLEAG